MKSLKHFCLPGILALSALLSSGVVTLAQEPPTDAAQKTDAVKPTDCIADAKTAAATAEYGGKPYYFQNQACKDEFLTDPERYSQLYDALLELKAQGKPLQKPKPLDNASQVPS